MATSYELSVGYQSGYSSDHDKMSAWEILKQVVLETAANPYLIYEEARAFGAPDVCPCGCGATLLEHCQIYQTQGFSVNEVGAFWIDDSEQIVSLIASQSGAVGRRDLKEHSRRAFCRLVLYAMHKSGIEVSLRVS